MPAWGDLLGGAGSVTEQLLVWGVLNQLIGDLLSPTLELVRQELAADNPIWTLSPADLADAVIRNYMDPEAAASEAAKSGLDSARFGLLVDAAGQPPGPEWLARAQLRGDILGQGTGPDATSYQQGIAEGDTKNKWAEIILKGSMEWPSPDEIVNAYVRGQLDQAAATSLYGQTGGDPQWFQLRVDTRGNPPSPSELLELLRRKLIPLSGLGPEVTSFQQGIYEGDAKDKWWTLYADLAEYIPPPRTVVALLKTGAITSDQAAAHFQDAGMSADLAAQYVNSAKGEKLAGSKKLAEQNVLTLYEAQALTAAEATGYLETLGYDASDAAFMLELADFNRETKAVTSAISKVGTLYVGHKITRPAAADALGALGVVGPHQANLLHTWDLEAGANVKLLTQAEITAAYEYQVMTQAEAQSELVMLGYTPFDAWVLLSNKAKGPLPDPPPQGPPGPGVVP